MSETLIELIDQQDDKLTQHMDKALEHMESRITSLLHKEIHTLTWRIITAAIASWSIIAGAIYFIVR